MRLLAFQSLASHSFLYTRNEDNFIVLIIDLFPHYRHSWTKMLSLCRSRFRSLFFCLCLNLRLATMQ